MKVWLASLVALFLLMTSVAWGQADNPDGPWALKNADIYGTNVTAAPYIFGSGGVRVREVPLPAGVQPPRHGFHSQILFDSRGNLYWRGSNNEPTPSPTESVSIYSLAPDGSLRWKSDNLFGHFGSWGGLLIGQQRVYAVGREFGKAGPGSRPVLAALDKNTGATLWTLPLPPGPTYWSCAMTLANGTLYVASEPWMKTVGEEDVPVITGMAVNAANGAVTFINDYPLPAGIPISTAIAGIPNQSFTIVPDAFPGRVPGIFFNLRGTRAGVETIFAINLATGAMQWRQVGELANHNHLVYSPANRELYKVSWSDYGYTFTVYDVATGAIKGRLNTRTESVLDPIAPSDGSPNPLRHEVGGHGWCDTACLLPDGRSIITSDFNGVVSIYSSDGRGNLSHRILLSGPSHWGEMHHFAQLIPVPAGPAPGGVWIAMTRHNADDPLRSETVQVIAVDVTTGQVLWQYDTGIWGPLWHHFYTFEYGARAPVAISPNGRLYYVRQNALYIIEPAEAPQIDGTVKLVGFIGSPKYGSGDGEWVVAPPLTLEFRRPGTTDVVFRKSIALNVNTATESGAAVGGFKLNGITPGTYDIAAKRYIQERFGRYYEFSHWLRAVARSVVVPPTGAGSVSVDLILFNADADNDNEVTLFDFGLLVQAFGSVRGDSNWSQAVDFDGDEEITLFDFGVLVQNFGLIGEE
ncbi:MAG: hypothetical protein RMM08_05665 [Armatimonadota bacterium]|nr:hypothetical protein [Armatimonadota bacterium]